MGTRARPGRDSIASRVLPRGNSTSLKAKMRIMASRGHRRGMNSRVYSRFAILFQSKRAKTG